MRNTVIYPIAMYLTW